MSQLIALRMSEPFLCIMYKVPKVSIQVMIDYQSNMLPIVAVDQVTDCMDLFELCCGHKGIPSDKLQRIIVLSLREDRLRGNIRTFMHWPTAVMLADGFTKVGHFPQLLVYATSGVVRLTLPSDKYVRQRTRLPNLKGHAEKDLINLDH